MNTQKENHFNQAAANWDSPEKVKQAEHYAAQIKTALNKSQFAKVLEVGCGTGLLGGNFMMSENQYVGLDTSEGMLSVLHEKFPNSQNVRTYLLNLDTDEIPEAGFDLVISSMAFHHLRHPEITMTHLAPKVTSGGALAIIDLDTEDGTFHPDPKAMGVHHFGFSEEQTQAWAKAAGLQFLRRFIVHTAEKNGKSYPIFLALFQKK